MSSSRNRSIALAKCLCNSRNLNQRCSAVAIHTSLTLVHYADKSCSGSENLSLWSKLLYLNSLCRIGGAAAERKEQVVSVGPHAILARGPVHPASTDEMQVDVLHRLLRIRTIVENRAVTVCQPLVGGNFLRYQEQVSDERFVFLGQVVERGDGLAGHNQDVRRRLGIDVAQGHAPVILIKDLPRLLSVHDLLE